MKLMLMNDYEVVYDDAMMLHDYYYDMLIMFMLTLYATWLLLWYVDNVYVDAIVLHDYYYDMLMIWCYMIYDMMLHVYDDDMVLYYLWYMLMKFKLLSVIDELYA
jgi:hypothetical protein